MTNKLFRYKKEFGFVLTDRKIVIDDVRVRGVGKSNISPAASKLNHGKVEGPVKKMVKTIIISLE